MNLINSSFKKDSAMHFVDTLQFDKDKFKEDLAFMAYHCFKTGVVTTTDLIDIYEFNNGLEMTIKGELVEPEEPDPSTVLLFFYDYDDKVAVLARQKDDNPQLFPKITYSQPEIQRMAVSFRDTVSNANPANPSRLEQKTSGLFKMLTPLCDKLVDAYPDAKCICFLPGKTFTNFPLHLMRTSSGQYLIDKYPLLYSPNLHIALGAGEQDTPRTTEAAVVYTPKGDDTPDFKTRMEELILFLKKVAAIPAKAIVREASADLENTLQQLNEKTEVVFLCHGIPAGPIYGNAICLSYAGKLPGFFLSFPQSPVWKSHLLTWKDIATCDRTPAVFVSMACSSGYITLKEAGVRYGLEQALFSCTTKIVISPLWDVQQQSAIYFIENFYQHRKDYPDQKIIDHFHSAVLAVKAKYPNFFFWGPMAFTGNILN